MADAEPKQVALGFLTAPSKGRNMYGPETMTKRLIQPVTHYLHNAVGMITLWGEGIVPTLDDVDGRTWGRKPRCLDMQEAACLYAQHCCIECLSGKVTVTS